MQTNSRFQSAGLLLMGVLILGAAGCSKKPPIPPPPPPPTSGGSTSSTTSTSGSDLATVTEFAVEPSTIERGQSAMLRWNVAGSNDVTIDKGIGTVPAAGTRRVVPTETTTYTLSAAGRVGSTTATATVTVTGPAPPPPTTSNTRNTNMGTLESRIQSDLQDALFGYDSNNIEETARVVLGSDAEAIKRIFADFPTATINVEGHCDERGSAEYNLGLGDRRASSTRDYLIQLGVPADRLKTISYGKERPACTESNEGCWQRNRRAHFSTGQ
ncbi:MAG: OmpA family protein [Terriglobia bacterium]